jgi:hypothetical protein
MNHYNLKFNNKHFQSGDIVSYKIRFMPWYFKMLGFRYKHEAEVIDEPRPEGDNWVYKLKTTYQGLYWFKIKIKDLNI